MFALLALTVFRPLWDVSHRLGPLAAVFDLRIRTVSHSTGGQQPVERTYMR